MDQTDRNRKKKYNPSELPSCFMTPESPGNHQFGRLTPCFEASQSSCFLTPPSSQEKDLSSQSRSISLQGLPKLKFELEDGDREKSMQHSLQRSPLLPEDRIIGRLIGRDSVDFIADLLAFGCTAICQKVCSYLEPLDLCSFASVSSTWRNFVKRNSQQRERWSKVLEECKEHFILKGQENRGTPPLQKSISYDDDLVRLPLKSINLNIPHRKEHDGPMLASVTPVLQIQHRPVTGQAGNELRPCPNCTSPSNVSKTLKGHFVCQKCGLRFCSICLRGTDRHASSKKCDGLLTDWTRNDPRLRSRTPGKDIVGSKKTKERLRRL